MVERLRATIVLALLPVAAWPAAHAQTGLADPTRPPSVVAGASSDGGPRAAESRLQSVLISPTRRLAVIDGRTVALGEKVGEATLVQVAETQVTLKLGNELKTLELFPAIQRKAQVQVRKTENSR